MIWSANLSIRIYKCTGLVFVGLSIDYGIFCFDHNTHELNYGKGYNHIFLEANLVVCLSIIDTKKSTGTSKITRIVLSFQ